MAAEIISTVERRRNWPTEVKLRIMEEAVAPDACIAAVADRNGVCRSLLYSWLRLARDDKMPGISITPQSTASFLPVRIEPPAKAPAPPAKPDVNPPAPPRVSSRGRRVMSKTCLHPYNDGETSAIRDAGRRDFSLTTIFTTLSPCDVCATLLCLRQFDRVVVGDITNASGNEQLLRDKGVKVEILEDATGIALYAKYRAEKPDQDMEDWKGLAAVPRKSPCPGHP